MKIANLQAYGSDLEICIYHLPTKIEKVLDKNCKISRQIHLHMRDACEQQQAEHAQDRERQSRAFCLEPPSPIFVASRISSRRKFATITATLIGMELKLASSDQQKRGHEVNYTSTAWISNRGFKTPPWGLVSSVGNLLIIYSLSLCHETGVWIHVWVLSFAL